MEEPLFAENRYPVWNRQVLLAKSVQSWLDQADVKIEYYWWNDKHKVVLGTPSLFAALSVQLMSTVSRNGIAICSNCGDIYIPTRAPRRDQRSYCSKEECKRASWKDAKKDQRRKPPGYQRRAYKRTKM